MYACPEHYAVTSYLFNCKVSSLQTLSFQGFPQLRVSQYVFRFKTITRLEVISLPQLIWQYGDRHYHAKKWMEAADWFRVGSHQIFKSMGSSSRTKCLRKAALCHIQRREYAQAAAEIRHCATNEATTHYVVLLIAVHQG